MIIFIDESGVHKSIDFSTISFVYVCFDNLVDMEKKILEIENNLNIQSFHWSEYGSKNGWIIRENFLIEISKLDFTFKISIFKNPVNFSEKFENTFMHLIVENRIKKIIIDGKKPRWYENRLKKVLRDKNISIKKIKTGNDVSNPGLRVADALAGLYRSHYDNPTDKTRKIIKLFSNKITVQILDGQISR